MDDAVEIESQVVVDEPFRTAVLERWQREEICTYLRRRSLALLLKPRHGEERPDCGICAVTFSQRWTTSAPAPAPLRCAFLGAGNTSTRVPMTITELQNASEELTTAIEAAEDEETSERLREQSEQLSTLASSGGADHGRLARHQHALSELAADANDDVAEHVETARGHISAYRETVEGV